MKGQGLRSERGSVVLLVLLLLTLFVGLGFAFRQTMGLEGRMIALRVHRQQALEAARAGLEVGFSLLRSDDPSWDSRQDGWASSSGLRGELGPGITYSLLADPEVPDNGVVDLDSRLPVHTLPESVLGRIPGLTPTTVAAVVQARAGQGLTTLQDFLTLSHLDAKVFTQAASEPLERVLTVMGRDLQLNANTASAFALGVVLGDEALARRLVERRRGADGRDGTQDDRPWTSLDELRSDLGAQANQPEASLLGVRSRFYVVTATGEARDGSFYSRRRLKAVIERTAGSIQMLSFSEL